MVERSQIPEISLFKQFIRPKGDTELFARALRMIALDQVREVKDEVLYRIPQREQKNVVKHLADAYQELRSTFAASSETSGQENTLRDDFQPGASSTESRVDVDEHRTEVEATRTHINHESLHESNAPPHLTKEEVKLFWDREGSCVNSRTNYHDWNALAEVFKQAADSQYEARDVQTVWYRSGDRLKNYFFNHSQDQRPRRLLSEESTTSNKRQRSDEVENNSSTEPLPTEISSDVATASAATTRQPMTGTLQPWEDAWIIATGKSLKEKGEHVTAEKLYLMYTTDHKSYIRDRSDLANRWQKYYDNQRKDKSAWYKSLLKNTSSG
jgi:hypothetical protein